MAGAAALVPAALPRDGTRRAFPAVAPQAARKGRVAARHGKATEAKHESPTLARLGKATPTKRETPTLARRGKVAGVRRATPSTTVRATPASPVPASLPRLRGPIAVSKHAVAASAAATVLAPRRAPATSVAAPKHDRSHAVVASKGASVARRVATASKPQRRARPVPYSTPEPPLGYDARLLLFDEQPDAIVAQPQMTGIRVRGRMLAVPTPVPAIATGEPSISASSSR